MRGEKAGLRRGGEGPDHTEKEIKKKREREAIWFCFASEENESYHLGLRKRGGRKASRKEKSRKKIILSKSGRKKDKDGN